MSAIELPIRRPVATAMLFLGILLLGAIAWIRIPVELMPPVGGNTLYVGFVRPGSEPEAVEREILMPLEARIGELAGIEETRAEVRGSSGTLEIRFAPGTDIALRELDLRRLASELAREQPRGTFVDVSARDLSAISRFAMFVQVTGHDDRNALLDLVEERVVPRLLAVPGVSSVQAGGGAPREVTVRVDPDRCAAAGVEPQSVLFALDRAVRREAFLGGVEDDAGRTAVVLDGRPVGLVSLADTRIDATRAVLLRHVADVEFGTGREEMSFRVNGKPTVALVVFQDETANLIALGHDLRAKLDALRDEFRPYGLDFVINFDSSELVEEQLDRLEGLAASGFLIALVVLYLYLRQWLAVGIVATAVPASLLAGLALLYLAGQSLNLLTLFGLAVAIGMLVDNSIVVYEAVQHRLERGLAPDAAAIGGVRRTVRAILAASVTNAIVFLPVAFADFEDAIVRSLLEVLALAIVLPMLASVLVAIGLVPLLARRLAAPAAIARIAELRRRRVRQAGFIAPDRGRGLAAALLVVVLRRPGGWVASVAVAVLITMVVAASWLVVGLAGQEPSEADTVRLSVTFDSNGSMDQATASIARLEESAMRLPGVERVESMIQEEGGSLTVQLLPKEERPDSIDAGRVRGVLRETAEEVQGLQVESESASFGGGGGGLGGGEGGGLAALMGQASARVVLSGPDARELGELAHDIAARLESISEVESAIVGTRSGQEEIRVAPDAAALAAFGVTGDQILPALAVVRREGVEMQTGFVTAGGREIPLTVRREPTRRIASEDLRGLRLATPAGVLPLGALAEIRRMPPPPTIVHHDGRREIEVSYVLGREAPSSGPRRKALEAEIRRAVQEVHRPAGYTIEAPEADAGFSWFKRILVPVVLLLFAVLAVTFESLTLPALVLVSLPLTLLGATWALVLTGTPADTMALVGALALIGLTVNPAILLVDRMQERARGGMSAGAAALASVRERARPVLMTTSTTIAGLWPLSLATGAENEIWPPFATIVMGGLATSTLLTLLFIPVGFVFLRRLDLIFGRLGPWVVMGWMLATAAIVAPLVVSGSITSLTWQLVTTALVAAALLGIAVLAIWRPEAPTPETAGGPPVVEARYLSKVYGRPGPVGRAWHAGQRFAARVLASGGIPFDPRQSRERLMSIALLGAGALYLATTIGSVFWRSVAMAAVAALGARLLRELRRARGHADALGRVEPGGPEGAAAFMAPWVVMSWAVLDLHLLARLEGESPEVRGWFAGIAVVALALGQAARRTARRVAAGEIPDWVAEGRLRRPRTIWRRVCRKVFGFDLPRREVRALTNAHFRAERGMIGILGPNGAGKTTLLRNLAGILDPTQGVVVLGGVPLRRLRRFLARWIGYLPQDFGLPDDLTAREYLDYFALHYELTPPAMRRERVEQLLREVGLSERAGEQIGSYSGGMRQRVAVARTLLRLPPVIIVDEPTVGLDPRERIRFRNLLARLAEGRVVLFSTHVVEDVEVACERVVVLARGKIVFDGEPSGLAEIAAGRVWTARLRQGDEGSLTAGAMIVDQVPEADGRVRTRLLCDTPPVDGAEPVPPSLEDGYLWLVGEVPRPASAAGAA